MLLLNVWVSNILDPKLTGNFQVLRDRQLYKTSTFDVRVSDDPIRGVRF